MDNAHKVKRLGIFAFYDTFGIVDHYIERLLNDSLIVMNELVVVVNGIITDSSRQKLERYSDRIFIRENIGFDGGAYKDALLKFLTWEKVKEWDEVVLFNATFYGPLFSWEQVFEKMDKEQVDFWGLSRYNGAKYPSHIQSYFLVCRKRLIVSSAFWNFWNTLEYPKSRLEAAEKFEISFTPYFSEAGFYYKVYTDVLEKQIGVRCIFSDIPYISQVDELLIKLQFPIIKRRALTIENFIKAKRALDYVKENTNYSVDLIYTHLKRLSEENQITPFSPLSLKLFYDAHERVYIYGHGELGKNTAAYFDSKEWKYEGFLVSVNSEDERNVYAYEDMEFTDSDGIILALGKKAFWEVYPIVKKDFAESQLFLPFEIF